MIHYILTIKSPGEPVYSNILTNVYQRRELDVNLVAGVLQALNTFSSEVFKEEATKIVLEHYDVLIYRLLRNHIIIFIIDRNDISSYPVIGDIVANINLAIKRNGDMSKEDFSKMVNENVIRALEREYEEFRLTDLLNLTKHLQKEIVYPIKEEALEKTEL